MSGKNAKRLLAAPPGGEIPAGGEVFVEPRPPVRKKRVTLADIARHAGVSPSTVSITLADRRDIVIPEITRERVRRSADKLGYLPSRLGDGFLHGRSRIVGILVQTDAYLPLLECMAGIHMGLAEADYTPLIISSYWVHGYVKGGRAGSPGNAGTLPDLNRLMEYQVEGVLYFSINMPHADACIGELIRRKIPTVVLGGADRFNGAVDVVGGDNEAVGRLAAEHLLSVGCGSFACGKSPAFHYLDNIVDNSFVARLREEGHDCRFFAAGAVSAQNPDKLGRSLARLVRPPAGLFSAREGIAAMAMKAAFSRGWWVPRDCALAAMGQMSLARFNAPSITTVERNSFAAGEAAAKLLIRRIEGFAGRPRRILITPTLQKRSSSSSDVSWLLRSSEEPGPAY